LHKIKDGGESLHNNAQRVEVWAGRDCFFFKSFLSGRILDRQRVDGHRLSIGQNRAEQSTLRILRCHFDERKSAARIFLLRILLKISRRSMILSRRGIYGCIAKAFFWH